MSATFRAELFKERTTRTGLGLVVAMLGLVLFAVLLHASSLPAGNVDSTSDQLTVVFGWGEVFGSLFATILGALSVTGEIRHGTIRPTLLVTPKRSRIVIAKIEASLLIGMGYGIAAAALAMITGVSTLRARGIDVQPDFIDFTYMVAGGAVAAALSAAFGVGLGALVRNQIPLIIGICVWLLFIESLLLGDITGLGDTGRFLPGAAGRSVSGQDPDVYLAPPVGLVVLILYAGAAAIFGCLAISRRDLD